MRLLELYGTPAPIRTNFSTRWNSEKVCQEVACPNGHGWQRLTHNAHCHYCCLDLVEQPVPVATPEQETAQLLVTVNEELAKVQQPAATQEEIAATQARLLRPDDINQIVFFIQQDRRAEEYAKKQAEWEASRTIQTTENACEAEPGPIAEPVALRPVSPDKKQYFVVWAISQSDDKKKYALLCQRTSGLAVNCSCPSRTHRKGRACKHMMAHNNMLKAATEIPEAA